MSIFVDIGAGLVAAYFRYKGANVTFGAGGCGCSVNQLYLYLGHVDLAIEKQG